MEIVLFLSYLYLLFSTRRDKGTEIHRVHAKKRDFIEHPEKYNNYLCLLHEHHELLPQVVQQIKKDFGDLMSQEAQPLSGPHMYESIYQWVYPVLQQLYKNDRRRFTSLMYTVDAAYMKNKFGQRHEHELVQWTHAVILRECLKVFIRNNYTV